MVGLIHSGSGSDISPILAPVPTKKAGTSWLRLLDPEVCSALDLGALVNIVFIIFLPT